MSIWKKQHRILIRMMLAILKKLKRERVMVTVQTKVGAELKTSMVMFIKSWAVHIKSCEKITILKVEV